MGKIAEVSCTATFTWSHKQRPVLATGTAAGTVDANFSTDSKLELWPLLTSREGDREKPLVSLEAEARFHDLDWSLDDKLIAGALENGVVELFAVETDNDDCFSLQSKAKLNKHSGSVKAVSFNHKQHNVFVSGDANGEMFVWDTNKCMTNDYSPMSPGVPMASVDKITSLSWNRSLAHVFASAGNSSFASIWDLKAKKEVIHLSYTSLATGAKLPLGLVEWHPENSTRLATAVNSDSEPQILIWDLRNSNSPLQILTGSHSKSVLSLDWCHQDQNLMLSGGRDGVVTLWNPETSLPLSQYQVKGSWCFKAKFAPRMPEVFASASLDGNIGVQTIQDLETSLDKEGNSMAQQQSDTDFWNSVSHDQTVAKPTVLNIQAPSWYGNKSPGASWAFGGKLVQIMPDKHSVIVTKPNVQTLQIDTLLQDALKTEDFMPVINQRLIKPINDINEEDWNVLEKIAANGRQEFMKEFLEIEDNKNEKPDTIDEGESFFANLEDSFQLEGDFLLKETADLNAAKYLVTGNLKKAASNFLEDGSLLEALLVALDSDDESLKSHVKKSYFAKYGKQSPLSRFLFSVSQRDAADLVKNLDVEQWKYTVQAVNTFHADNATEKNNLLTELGDRLLMSNKRCEALAVYLEANSLDKMASIWLDEFSILESTLRDQKQSLYSAHTICLTQFVEKLTITANMLKEVPAIKNENTISKCLEFISIAATSGNFDLAFKLLETLPQDMSEVKAEVQRVAIASGKSAAATTNIHTLNNRKTRYADIGTAATMSLPKQPATLPHYQPYGTVLPPGSIMPPQKPILPQGSSTTPYAPTKVQNIPAKELPTPLPGRGNPYMPNASLGPTFSHSQYGGPTTRSSATASQTSLNKITSTTSMNGMPIVQSGEGLVKQPMQQPIQPVQPSFVVPGNQFAGAGFQQPQAAFMPFSGTTTSAYVGSEAGSAAESLQHGTASGMSSGQTPGMNRKANDGWNDLPMQLKEKPSRAKPVAVALTSTTAQSTGIPSSNNGSFLPPPPMSRATSSASVTPIQAMSRGSRKSSGTGNAMQPFAMTPKSTHVNPYAPQTPQSMAMPSAPVSNPYAPPASAAPVTNQYAPSSEPVSAAPAPLDASKGYRAMPNATNIPLAQKVNLGPPPISGKKKLHSEKKIADASNALNSAQGTVPSVQNGKQNTLQGIPPEQQPIVDFFKQELARVAPLIPQEYSKQLKDCNKRLKILFHHLENRDLLTAPTIAKLHRIVELMQAHQYEEALKVHADIATNHAQEGGNWLTGVKRLVNIADATSQ